MFIRPDDLNKQEYAEAELLEAVRGELPSRDFSLTITRLGNVWVVSAGQVTSAESRSTGTGSTFAEAWLQQTDGPVAAVGGQ